MVGIDEWAWKKGHRYGTIVCDIEQGRVIDLLPNRSTETVGGWLREHPSVQIVSRDRASAFADAISKGAPRAVQVADRWHLLNNLIDTLGRSLERHRRTLSEVAVKVIPKSSTPAMAEVKPEQLTKALACKQQNRERRLARCQELRDLLEGGMNRSEAARHLGLPLRTVQRWLAYGVFPDPAKHRYLKKLYRLSPKNASLGHAARGLFDIMLIQNAAAWPRWLDAAECSPLASYSRRLRRDQHAVARRWSCLGGMAWLKDRSIG